jgi:hypothetical protein
MPSIDLNRRFWSVKELLENVPCLGLPHFQRGAVWRESQVSLLLDSLMLDTPCGTIILWVPDNLEADFDSLGVLCWGEDSARPAVALVIDGQQRISALREVFEPSNGWAFNPAAEPELARRIDNATLDLKKDSLFRRRNNVPPLEDEVEGQAHSPSRTKLRKENACLIRLSDIFEGRAPDDLWKDISATGDVPESFGRMIGEIRQILERHLHVVVKRQGTSRYDLHEMIELYNRINSSGIRVAEEERAFAAMVGIKKDTSKWLADIFRGVHDEADSVGRSHLEKRNQLLKREREKMFGFKLFVHTFVKAVAYHKNEPYPRMDALEYSVWQGSLKKDPEALSTLSADCREALITTARVLREDLGCDDFRYLPSAEALAPVFTLLFAYPSMDRRVVAWLILCGQVSWKTNVTALRGVLRNVLSLKRTIDDSFDRKVLQRLPDQSDLKERLDEAKTTQNRYVSLLYWLLRRRGAGDLRDRNSGAGSLLCKASGAERQHVVPYAQLRGAFEMGTRRPGRHSIHSIGNLTFIAGAANWDLSDDVKYVARLAEEEREKHLLSGQVFEKWSEVADTLTTRPHGYSETRDAFDVFATKRREIMAVEFDRWFRDVERCADEALWTQKPELRPPLLDKDVRRIVGKRWERELELAAMRILSISRGNSRGFFRLAGLGRGGIPQQIRLRHDCDWLYVGRRSSKADKVLSKLEQLGSAVHREDWETVVGWHLQFDTPEQQKAAANFLTAVYEALS